MVGPIQIGNGTKMARGVTRFSGSPRRTGSTRKSGGCGCGGKR